MRKNLYSDPPKFSFFAFDDNEVLYAGFIHAEDAALYVGGQDGFTIQNTDKKILWTEGSETFSASESYDRAADVMLSRNDA